MDTGCAHASTEHENIQNAGNTQHIENLKKDSTDNKTVDPSPRSVCHDENIVAIVNNQIKVHSLDIKEGSGEDHILGIGKNPIGDLKELSGEFVPKIITGRRSEVYEEKFPDESTESWNYHDTLKVEGNGLFPSLSTLRSSRAYEDSSRAYEDSFPVKAGSSVVEESTNNSVHECDDELNPNNASAIPEIIPESNLSSKSDKDRKVLITPNLAENVEEFEIEIDEKETLNEKDEATNCQESCNLGGFVADAQKSIQEILVPRISDCFLKSQSSLKSAEDKEPKKQVSTTQHLDANELKIDGNGSTEEIFEENEFGTEIFVVIDGENYKDVENCHSDNESSIFGSIIEDSICGSIIKDTDVSNDHSRCNGIPCQDITGIQNSNNQINTNSEVSTTDINPIKIEVNHDNDGNTSSILELAGGNELDEGKIDSIKEASLDKLIGNFDGNQNEVKSSSADDLKKEIVNDVDVGGGSCNCTEFFLTDTTSVSEDVQICSSTECFVTDTTSVSGDMYVAKKNVAGLNKENVLQKRGSEDSNRCTVKFPFDENKKFIEGNENSGNIVIQEQGKDKETVVPQDQENSTNILTQEEINTGTVMPQQHYDDVSSLKNDCNIDEYATNTKILDKNESNEETIHEFCNEKQESQNCGDNECLIAEMNSKKGEINTDISIIHESPKCSKRSELEAKESTSKEEIMQYKKYEENDSAGIAIKKNSSEIEMLIAKVGNEEDNGNIVLQEQEKDKETVVAQDEENSKINVPQEKEQKRESEDSIRRTDSFPFDEKHFRLGNEDSGNIVLQEQGKDKEMAVTHDKDKSKTIMSQEDIHDFFGEKQESQKCDNECLIAEMNSTKGEINTDISIIHESPKCSEKYEENDSAGIGINILEIEVSIAKVANEEDNGKIVLQEEEKNKETVVTQDEDNSKINMPQEKGQKRESEDSIRRTDSFPFDEKHFRLGNEDSGDTVLQEQGKDRETVVPQDQENSKTIIPQEEKINIGTFMPPQHYNDVSSLKNECNINEYATNVKILDKNESNEENKDSRDIVLQEQGKDKETVVSQDQENSKTSMPQEEEINIGTSTPPQHYNDVSSLKNDCNIDEYATNTKILDKNESNEENKNSKYFVLQEQEKDKETVVSQDQENSKTSMLQEEEINIGTSMPPQHYNDVSSLKNDCNIDEYATNTKILDKKESNEENKDSGNIVLQEQGKDKETVVSQDQENSKICMPQEEEINTGTFIPPQHFNDVSSLKNDCNIDEYATNTKILDKNESTEETIHDFCGEKQESQNCSDNECLIAEMNSKKGKINTEIYGNRNSIQEFTGESELNDSNIDSKNEASVDELAGNLDDASNENAPSFNQNRVKSNTDDDLKKDISNDAHGKTSRKGEAQLEKWEIKQKRESAYETICEGSLFLNRNENFLENIYVPLREKRGIIIHEPPIYSEKNEEGKVKESALKEEIMQHEEYGENVIKTNSLEIEVLSKSIIHEPPIYSEKNEAEAKAKESALKEEIMQHEEYGENVIKTDSLEIEVLIAKVGKEEDNGKISLQEQEKDKETVVAQDEENSKINMPQEKEQKRESKSIIHEPPIYSENVFVSQHYNDDVSSFRDEFDCNIDEFAANTESHSGHKFTSTIVGVPSEIAFLSPPVSPSNSENQNQDFSLILNTKSGEEQAAYLYNQLNNLTGLMHEVLDNKTNAGTGQNSHLDEITNEKLMEVNFPITQSISSNRNTIGFANKSNSNLIELSSLINRISSMKSDLHVVLSHNAWSQGKDENELIKEFDLLTSLSSRNAALKKDVCMYLDISQSIRHPETEMELAAQTALIAELEAEVVIREENLSVKVDQNVKATRMAELKAQLVVHEAKLGAKVAQEARKAQREASASRATELGAQSARETELLTQLAVQEAELGAKVAQEARKAERKAYASRATELAVQSAHETELLTQMVRKVELADQAIRDAELKAQATREAKAALDAKLANMREEHTHVVPTVTPKSALQMIESSKNNYEEKHNQMTSAEKGDLRSLLNVMKAISYESKEEKVQSVDRKLSDHAKESQDDKKSYKTSMEGFSQLNNTLMDAEHKEISESQLFQGKISGQISGHSLNAVLDDFKWLEDKNHLEYQNELHKEGPSDFDEENLEVLVSIMGAIKADIEQMIQFL